MSREKLNSLVDEFYKSRMAEFLSCLAEGAVSDLPVSYIGRGSDFKKVVKLILYG